jgi:HlyD family secretion protein
MHRLLLSSLLLACLAGCDAGGEQLLGTLEWDRVGLPAEASETVLSWQVAEGDRVEAGQLLLELDPRRQDARIAQARGEVAQAAARLAELSNGARSETIDSARASLARSRAEQVDAERNFTRIAELHRRKMVAMAELDRARAARDQSGAATRSAEAQLRELTNGTRPEQLEQAAAALDSARAGLAQLEVGREHLSLRAPRAGVVDALPFKVGDRPPAGAEVASLLVGEAPYARVFVPADIRAQVRVGDRLRVFVEGIEQPFQAHVRTIRSEASFTPYYALTGDDASRLMYRAELLLEGEAARRLPAGLPLHAERLSGEPQR